MHGQPRASLPLAALVIVVGIAACSRITGASPGQSLAPEEPSASAANASSPASAASPAGPTSGPSDPVATALCPAGEIAATGPEVTTTDPDVTMHAPSGWVPLDIHLYGSQLQEAIEAANDERLTRLGDWQLDMINSNVMRSAAAGPTASGASTVVIVSVLPMPGDLKTVVDARLADETANALPFKVVASAPTDLPIGPAHCFGAVSDHDIGVPSQTIEYFAGLGDGRAISVSGTAPQDDGLFPDLMRSVAVSLRAN